MRHDSRPHEDRFSGIKWEWREAGNGPPPSSGGTADASAKQQRAANAIPLAQEIFDGLEDTSPAQVFAACLAGLDGFDIPAPP